jgi:T5SS/PEP-CTERM-associated repeat protein
MMRSALRLSRVVLGLVCISLCSTAHAQFSSDFQTNIISGLVTNSTGSYIVGNSTAFDVLRIESGGALFSTSASIGYNAAASNDTAIVTGSGSVWTNSGFRFSIGEFGSGNCLVISNGGTVVDYEGDIGDEVGSVSNRVLVTGSGSVWSNTQIFVGNSAAASSLVVGEGGSVYAGDFQEGVYLTSASNNLVVIAGTGSVLRCGECTFGTASAGNRLIITNGGSVYTSDPESKVGVSSLASNNVVVVTGSGSVWSVAQSIYVGYGSSANQLLILDGGSVVAPFGVVAGEHAGAVGNEITVAGGNLYATSGDIWVGCAGAGEMSVSNGTVLAQGITVGTLGGSQGTLTIAGGTTVVQSNMLVGTASCTATGTVLIAGGTCVITNASHSAILDVRSGTVVVNSGTLIVDTLVVTNGCGRFIHTGGTLIVGSLVLNPSLSVTGDGLPNAWKQQYGLDPLSTNGVNGVDGDPDGDGKSNLQEYLAGTDPTNSASTFHITAISPEHNDIRVTWMTGIGRTNALQASLDISTNFADVFTVTNTISTVTNYLDVGAGINWPARFYRVRLIP